MSLKTQPVTSRARTLSRCKCIPATFLLGPAPGPEWPSQRRSPSRTVHWETEAQQRRLTNLGEAAGTGENRGVPERNWSSVGCVFAPSANIHRSCWSKPLMSPVEDRCPERGKDVAEVPEQARAEHRPPAPGVSSHFTSGFSSPSGLSSRFSPLRSHCLSSGLLSARRGRGG